jgi:hypothetical protein
MTKKFLVPVASAIAALFSHQTYASIYPHTGATEAIRVDNQAPLGSDTIVPVSTGTASELSTFSDGNEYRFLLERSDAGILMAYHSSHRSHSSHSSHRSHYSSR